MSKVNQDKLLSERTFGVPPVIFMHWTFDILFKQQAWVWGSAARLHGRSKRHNNNISIPAPDNNISTSASNNSISTSASRKHQHPPPTSSAFPCFSPRLPRQEGAWTAACLPRCHAVNKFFIPIIQPRSCCSQDSSLLYSACFQPSRNVNLPILTKTSLAVPDGSDYYRNTTETEKGSYLPIKDLLYFWSYSKVPVLPIPRESVSTERTSCLLTTSGLLMSCQAFQS